VDTVRNPLEIWRVLYSDGSYRLAFIGAYAAKYQMLVVINVDHGQVLWNFMNCDKKHSTSTDMAIWFISDAWPPKNEKSSPRAAFF
jgi:hypothetical protein